MFNTPKNLDNRYKLILKVLMIIIVMAVVFHIFWQLVLLISNTDNRVVNDIVNRFGLDEELSFPYLGKFVNGTNSWYFSFYCWQEP